MFIRSASVASHVALVALLLALGAGCSDDNGGADSGAAGKGSAGTSNGGSNGSSDAGAGGSEAGASGETGGSEAGASGAGVGGDAGAGGESSAGASNGGTGGSSSATICDDVREYLTSCGQAQGALEASMNCDPGLELSQCIVPCLMEKPCDQLGNWPAPVVGCVSSCGG